ncbi:hypothetical protein ACFELO_11325 [Oceanicaulis sp. LC35]|uniref:hypothetical protein n=1 Tax=Oceanicaulis sp. LC35 TaxID=3349635 RepID=UPI003F877D57
MLGLVARHVTILIAGCGLAGVMTCAASAQPTRLGAIQQTQPQPDAPVAVEVDWQAVRRDVLQRQRASFTAVRAVPRPVVPGNVTAEEGVATEVPILTPTQDALGFEALANARLFPRGDFYTLVIEAEGMLIEVFGTRLAHAVPPDPLSARHLRGTGEEGYRSTPTAYGREITFHRYNAAYSITLECDAPETDTRCSAPAYGDGLYASLQLMPGTRDREAP